MNSHIWDSFLTSRDHTHLHIRPRRARPAWGIRPAVLNIDNYRRTAGDRPEPILDQIRTWPDAMGESAWDALDCIAEVLSAARATGTLVAHVRGLPTEQSGMPFPTGPEAEALSADEAERFRRWNEFMPQAEPLPGEIVLEKAAASAFFGTPLVSAFVFHGIDTLVLTGESTSGCVRATAVDAAARGFRVVIPEECVYDRYEASHAISLFDLHQKYATVLPVGEVIAHVQRQAHREVSR